MTVYRNGKEINKIPVTTGKPGFDTRNGIKVVLGKEYFVRMRGDQHRHRRGLVGLLRPAGLLRDPGDLERRVRPRRALVGRARRGTPTSATAAPGMSTEQRRVVLRHRARGRHRQGRQQRTATTWTPFGNGFGDWNLDWKNWRKGSALVAGTPDGRSPADRRRLRPESV